MRCAPLLDDLGKILIVKPSAFGDVVHSLPFLHALKTHYPGVEIHWVVAKGIHEILEDHPMIHRLWLMDKNRWKRMRNGKETFSEIRMLARGLRKERFDLVVDLQGLLRSGVISFLAGSKDRLGFKESREGSRLFYTRTIDGGRDIHAVERYLKMAAFLGCVTSDVQHPFPPLLRPGATLSLLPDDYIVLAPAAGAPVKRWPPERFGELASRLPLPSLVVAGNADLSLAQEVVNASKGKAASLAGQLTLKELAAVVSGARFVVCNDTGPMHIAAALGVPVFAVFGPTNPMRTGPYGDIHTIVREELPCSPCYRRKLCQDWRCMKAVTVERVLDLITASGRI